MPPPPTKKPTIRPSSSRSVDFRFILATDTSAIFERTLFLLNGGDRTRKHKGKKRPGAGGSKEEGENTFPIGKNKKGIGWRPQKNTGALSSQLGSSFSFERRLKNGGESFFSAGGSPHRRVLWFFLSMPLPFCSKKKDCGYKNSSEACGRFECMQVSQKRRSVTGNVFFKYG